MRSPTLTAALTVLAFSATLTARASAGSESQNGTLSGGAAPMTQQVQVNQFDTQGGTRVLDRVVLDFLTSTIGGGMSNGTGVPTQVFSQLDGNWSFQSVLIATTQGLINTTIPNTGPPGSFTVFNTDTAQVVYDQPLDLAPWIGSGQAVLEALTQLQVSEDPAGSTSFGAGGSVRWTATYEFSVFNNAFCDDSDNSLASCPCANPGAPNTGCDIQQGTGGVGLAALSQQTAPQNRVTWSGTGFPAASTPTSIVIRATGLDAGSPVVFGDGLRCIGTPLVRLAAAFAAGGTSTQVHGHGAGAGSGTFYYQLWFRNTPVMFCDPAAAFNLSNGRALIW